jgi:GTPase SAR1 family protein
MISCSQYCIENVERIAAPDYLPSYTDILQVRQRTTGVIETHFKIEKYTFTLIDVGGQRSERRKWIHCFENVDTLLYCVALDEYDMQSPEEETMNRMHEAIKVFEDTVNMHWFMNTSVIIFMNKEDLFREKIKEVDLNVCFPEYTGGKDKDAAIDYIKKVLVSKNRFPEKRTFYIHVTVATSTSNIRYVFNAVKDMIFSERIKMSGLML